MRKDGAGVSICKTCDSVAQLTKWLQKEDCEQQINLAIVFDWVYKNVFEQGFKNMPWWLDSSLEAAAHVVF